jgi:hypothetical protein
MFEHLVKNCCVGKVLETGVMNIAREHPEQMNVSSILFSRAVSIAIVI